MRLVISWHSSRGVARVVHSLDLDLFANGGHLVALVAFQLLQPQLLLLDGHLLLLHVDLSLLLISGLRAPLLHPHWGDPDLVLLVLAYLVLGEADGGMGMTLDAARSKALYLERYVLLGHLETEVIVYIVVLVGMAFNWQRWLQTELLLV